MRKHARSMQDETNKEPISKRRIMAKSVFHALFSESACDGNGKITESTITLIETPISNNDLSSLKGGKDVWRKNVQSFGELSDKNCDECSESSALSKTFQSGEVIEISPYDQCFSGEELPSVSDLRKPASSATFVLSSGRSVLKESPSDRIFPTVDEEFEQYFADLLI